ncbi:hypothetical protein [Clostridium tyrobutyricum]
MANSSKFNTSSLMTYCELKDIDYLITDKVQSKDY